MSQNPIFDADAVRKIVLDKVQTIFGRQKYNINNHNALSNRLTTQILEALDPDHNSPFKYIIHIVFFPEEAGGYDSYSFNYWDPDSDGMTVVNFDNELIQVSVTVWAVRA